MNNGFVNGSKVVVKINGSAVGGVLSAVCKRTNNLMKIEEFLTCKPVYSVQSPLYTIELKSRFDLSGLLNGQDFFSLTIGDGEKTTEYSGCSVESVGQQILPNSLTEYTAVINAADRSVEDE